MTQKDAMMFPLIASCALFSLYIFFQVQANVIAGVYILHFNPPPPGKMTVQTWENNDYVLMQNKSEKKKVKMKRKKEGGKFCFCRADERGITKHLQDYSWRREEQEKYDVCPNVRGKII